MKVILPCIARRGAPRYNRGMKVIAQARDKKNMRSGQAMLIAVLALGGAILGATSVAGLMMLYQIRATTDTANSAKAIFAADAGTEWALFNYYKGNSYCGANPDPSQCSSHHGELLPPTFAGSPPPSVTVNCYDNVAATGATTTCSDASTVAAISTGIANGSERAFFIGLSTTTTIYP